MVKFIKPTPYHIKQISKELRSEDIAEIYASSGRSPYESLINMDIETSYIMLDDNNNYVLFYGCPHHPQDETIGIPWMVGTERIKKVKKVFWKECKKVVEELNNKYALLINFTDARNKVHHVWLKRLGFEFIKLHYDIGYEKRPFWEFRKNRNNV